VNLARTGRANKVACPHPAVHRLAAGALVAAPVAGRQAAALAAERVVAAAGPPAAVLAAERAGAAEQAVVAHPARRPLRLGTGPEPLLRFLSKQLQILSILPGNSS
jgi:hypothetical protein